MHTFEQMFFNCNCNDCQILLFNVHIAIYVYMGTHMYTWYAVSFPFLFYSTLLHVFLVSRT